MLGILHQIPSKGAAHFKYVLSQRHLSSTVIKHTLDIFTEWAKIYGGIFSLKLGPGTAIVVTERRDERELVGNMIMGGDNVIVMDAGPKWRTMRIDRAGLYRKHV